MTKPDRKLVFVLAASDHGTMIVSRLDHRMASPTSGIGVGFQILEFGAFDAGEVSLAVSVLRLKRQYFNDGVVAIDCGANIGVHTVEWAKEMTGWGSVLAVEAQERIYYALAGNIAINNCFNAVAMCAAVSNTDGIMKIPRPNYMVASSFGSLELRQTETTEPIGQVIDYSEAALTTVRTVSIDSFNLTRIDFIKIDVEGMEMEALAGAEKAIAQHKPSLLIDAVKSDRAALHQWLSSRGYLIFGAGINVLAVHERDPILPYCTQKPAA